MMKVLRIRNTFHHDKYITVEANTTSGEADVSSSDESGGGGDKREPKRKVRRTEDERNEQEERRRTPTSDSDTSQSDSEMIRQWMFDKTKESEGEPSQPTSVNRDIGQASNKAEKPKYGVVLM